MNPNDLTLPEGFRAAGIHAGIKAGERPDMTLLVSDLAARVAGVFTKNQMFAAPVAVCREHLETDSLARAVIINSGNANACTGPSGLADARTMVSETAAALSVDEAAVYVCSTGSIGKPLPMPVISKGIAAAAKGLSRDGFDAATRGILTTDTGPKVSSRNVGGGRLVAFAKGAGMIEPNMATMLCFVMTDLVVDAPQPMLSAAVSQSFNRISVDGDMSTNDTVLLLANGASGHAVASAVFQEALDEVLLELALAIVADGEGTSKVVTLHVNGAPSDADADVVARIVANSLLVKTAWAGTYPSWGRILDAIGYAPVTVVPEKVSIQFDDISLVDGGLATGASDRAAVEKDEFTVIIDLGIGDGSAVLYTTDCTEDYVRLNKD